MYVGISIPVKGVAFEADIEEWTAIKPEFLRNVMRTENEKLY